MMGHRCCSKQKVKRGLWSPEEDERLANYITTHGHGSWSSVPRLAGLQRCGKSCRLRWINYLRPDLKRGTFSAQEEQIIIDVHRILGNRWAQIANHLPGRTDNEVKNFWNSCIKKKLMAHGLDPRTHNLIPARLRSHNHPSTLTTTKSGGSSQQPFSITTVKGHSTPESDPPLSSMNLSSLQDDHQNPDMLWNTGLVDQGFPASWAPAVDSDEVHEQSPGGYGLLVESSSAPQTTVTQQQARNVHGQPWWTHTEEGEGVRVGGGSQQGGATGSDIRAAEEEEEEMIGIGTTSSSFDCFDMDDPSFLSSSICRDLTSMDIIDLPWNF